MPVPSFLADSSSLYGLVAAAVLAAVTGLLCRPLLARAASSASTADHPDYRALGTLRFVVAVAATSLVAAVLVVGLAPVAAWPVWCGLCSLGVLLGWIDAATTWLPSVLMHPLWVVTALGVLATALIGWREDPATWWIRPLTAVAAAAGTGLLFAVVWRIGQGGFGFGDVRLSVVVGAATGACSVTTTLLAVLLGTGLGAVWAIGRLAQHHREPFPYGPFLLIGAVLAPLLT